MSGSFNPRRVAGVGIDPFVAHCSKCDRPAKGGLEDGTLLCREHMEEHNSPDDGSDGESDGLVYCTDCGKLATGAVFEVDDGLACADCFLPRRGDDDE